MICPYNQNSHVCSNMYKYDEETGNIKIQVIKEYWGQNPCLQEKCGVWRDGRCNYKE